MSKIKQIIIATFLLVFTLQVTASIVTSCKMVTQQHSDGLNEPSNMLKMDHSDHMMVVSSNDNKHSNEMLDCCASGENCSMSSCLSVLVLLPVEINLPKVLSQKKFYFTEILIHLFPNSLYRPPILS